MSKPSSYLKFQIAVDSNQLKTYCVTGKASPFIKVYLLFFILASVFFFSACNSGQANSAEQKRMKAQREKEINDSTIMNELFHEMTGNPDSVMNDISKEK